MSRHLRVDTVLKTLKGEKVIHHINIGNDVVELFCVDTKKPNSFLIDHYAEKLLQE